MSMDPQAMAQLLAGQLGGQQPQNPQAQVSPLGAAAQIAQKVMLMQALQKQPQQPGLPPPQQPNIMGQVSAQPQAMQAQQMPGGVNG